MRRQLYGDDERPKAFVLRHLNATKQAGDEILRVKVPQKCGEPWLKETLSEFELTAESDAGGFLGVQTYAIFAEFPGAKKTRIAFRVASNEALEGDSLDSEGPTKAGITGQLMRHNEGIFKTAILGFHESLTALQRQNARMEEALTQAFEDKLSTIRLVEKLHSREHERKMEDKAQEESQEIKKAALEKLALLLPVVVSKLTGQKLLPDSTNGQGSAVQKLVASLRPEQYEELQRVLTPEQLILVLELAGAKPDYEASEGKGNEQ